MKLFVPKLIPDIFESIELKEGVITNKGQIIDKVLNSHNDWYVAINNHQNKSFSATELEVQIPILHEYVPGGRPNKSNYSTIRKPLRGGYDEYLLHLNEWEERIKQSRVYLVSILYHDWFCQVYKESKEEGGLKRFVFETDFEVVEFDKLTYPNKTGFEFLSGISLPKVL